VSDGVWHHVEAKWMSNEVWLSLDHGQRELTQTFSAKVQGLYVGKILIGGPDASYVSLTSDFGYFDGCIQVRYSTKSPLCHQSQCFDNDIVIDNFETANEKRK